MSDYKYPYIPKEYYAAVMYACSCTRKYGTFNVACNAAAKKFGVDADIVAEHVRKRQAAGQKGTSRKYYYFAVVGLWDRWLHDYDIDILYSEAMQKQLDKVGDENILPHIDESTEYGVYEVVTGRRIDAGYGDPFRGFRMGELYDNREDCRNYEHEMYDGWERLREIQRAEETE